jgi:hypothetical protein
MMNESATVESEKRSLTEDERLEYAEIGELYRHDDQMVYTAATVFLPLAFGALAVGAQFPATSVWAAFFSLSIYLFWVLIATRCSWFTAVRLERARELERLSGMNHHLLLKEPPLALRKGAGHYISIRRLRWIFLLILLVGWAGVLFGV